MGEGPSKKVWVWKATATPHEAESKLQTVEGEVARLLREAGIETDTEEHTISVPSLAAQSIHYSFETEHRFQKEGTLLIRAERAFQDWLNIHMPEWSVRPDPLSGWLIDCDTYQEPECLEA
jgi:hypothetical protein